MDISDMELRRLSDNMGSEWQKLATYLGFTRAKIQQFELNHADGAGQCVENTIFDMLVSWKERQPIRTNFSKMIKIALEKCGRVDLADSISPVSPVTPKKPDVAQNHRKDVRKWNKTKIINKSNDKDGHFQSVFDVALHPEGNIAIVDRSAQQPIGLPRVYAFNDNGQPTSEFVLTPTRSEDAIGNLRSGQSTAVTNDGKYLIADGSTSVKVFDNKGVYLREFSTFPNPEGGMRPQAAVAKCITVARDNGNVLVGDWVRELVTVHDGGEFNLTSEVYIELQPNHIVANELQLWVSSWQDGKVVAFNYSGDELYTITPLLSATPARPNGMVCTSYGSVFVAVSKVNGRESKQVTGVTKTGSGHVHEYSASEGKFIRCLIKGLYWPLGMAMENDMLVIADKDEVKVYTP